MTPPEVVGAAAAGTAGTGGPALSPPRPRRRRLLRRTLWSFGSLVLVVAVVLSSMVAYASVKLGSRTVTCRTCRLATASGSGGSVNVLVLGSDARAGQPQLGQRADTIALFHVDLKTSHAVLINVPRDLRVKAPDGRFVKINSFYDEGPSAVVQAVTAFTGLAIDHYVEVNFEGFRAIVDTLDGVRVRFSQPVRDPDSGLDVPAGCVTLRGEQALAFVRLRNIDTDYGRIARQQFFVQLLLRQVLSAGTLFNPLKVVRLVEAAGNNLKTDKSLGALVLEKLAVQLRDFNPSNMDFRVVPSYPEYIAGTSFDTPYAGQSASLFDAIRNGTPLPDYGKQGTSPPPGSVATVILNGTTHPGLTTRAEADLKAAGYDVLATGKADTAEYAMTLVFYAPGHQDKASSVAQFYGGLPVQALPAALEGAAQASGRAGDVTVVLGRDYEQGRVGASPSASPPALLPAGPAGAIPTSSLAVSAC
ncbi:MAG: LCP family protein [Actinomycetota bacterium]